MLADVADCFGRPFGRLTDLNCLTDSSDTNQTLPNSCALILPLLMNCRTRIGLTSSFFAAAAVVIHSMRLNLSSATDLATNFFFCLTKSIVDDILLSERSKHPNRR